MPSWIRPGPLPLCTERANRVLVLASEVLKLSKVLLCEEDGEDQLGRPARSRDHGKLTVLSSNEFCPRESW